MSIKRATLRSQNIHTAVLMASIYLMSRICMRFALDLHSVFRFGCSFCTRLESDVVACFANSNEHSATFFQVFNFNRLKLSLSQRKKKRTVFALALVEPFHIESNASTRKQWRLSDETSMFIDISTRDEENTGPYLRFGIDAPYTKNISINISLSRHSYSASESPEEKKNHNSVLSFYGHH